MKNIKRHWPVVFGGFVVAVLPCIGVQAADAVTKQGADAKTLARGKYMVQTGHCNNCIRPITPARKAMCPRRCG